ncbi:MAG: hypothetical protein KJ069_30895 [Anaerolineae bacterium]|nr:hypothetical protein [Anaerolineae bacterium]
MGNEKNLDFEQKKAGEAGKLASSRQVKKQNTAKVGADGIVSATFDYFVAVKSGCLSSDQAFEVFPYGTATL